ncbi:MAG: hypothetical protein EBE86_001155 [Hormoscilla sp. GUM202]|nr:hypothetical protein [Hormoscilla sp. GUM202]
MVWPLCCRREVKKTWKNLVSGSRRSRQHRSSPDCMRSGAGGGLRED